MAKISFTTRLEAPPERVFDAFTDFERAAERIAAIQELEVLTDGPVGVGTRFRETRTVFSREATEEMEVTAFDAPRSYTVGCESCGAAFETVYRFVPEGENATRVEMDFEARPVTLFAKLMSPLSAMMIKTCGRAMEQDIEDLRKVVEASPEPAGI